MTYIAASANFPLMDEVFARLDVTMGFHWYAVNEWVQQHPAIQTVLWTAYGSSGMQLLGLLLVQCMRAPGIGTGELGLRGSSLQVESTASGARSVVTCDETVRGRS